jgi:DNA/RNA endonuclease YhcR with UshA esterase domain
MIGLLAVSVPAVAHHGNASYGHAKQLTLKGTVTEWDWLSPHTLLKLDVKDESGNVVNWVIEWSAPSNLINRGVNKKTFKPGDEVTVVMITPDNGAPVGRLQRVMLANGTWLQGQG